MSKALTNQRMKLDIRTMQADVYSPWSHRHGWKNGATAVLRFKHREKKATIELTAPGKEMHMTNVGLDKTAQHFGGNRVWWVCPCCEKRVGLLYWQSWRWQCRKCAELVHPSTRQTESSSAYSRVNRVRRKLRWGGGLLSQAGGRPRGMHRKTYNRLLKELAEAEVNAVGKGDASIERLSKRIGRIRMPSQP